MYFIRKLMESRVLKILVKFFPFFIAAAILIPPIVYYSINYQAIWIRLQIFGSNVVSFFSNLFGDSSTYPVQTLDLLKLNNITSDSLAFLSIIPDSISNFFLRIGLGFRIIFSKGYILYFIINSTQLLMWLTIILCCLTFIIPFYLLFNFIYFSPSGFEKDEISTAARLFNLIKSKIMSLLRYIKNCLSFFFSNKIVRVALIISILLQFRIIFVVFDLINYYLYFIASFDFKALWEAVILVAIDLLPILTKVPLIVYLVIAYLLFNKWRYSIADSTLRRHDALNCGFIKGSGVMIMINGAPGAGKTKLQTDMAITTEMMFRQQAHEIMDEIRDVFSKFRFDLFRKKLDYWIATRKIKNLVDVEELVYKFYFDELTRSIYFQNDIYHIKDYSLTFDNGLYRESLYEDLIDYGKAYFVYTFSSPLLISNYPIRVDHRMIDSGLNVVWDYDWFKKQCEEFPDYNYSKVIDYDMLRLNKKKNPTNENGDIPIAFVFALTELGKERGNSLENQEIKKMSDEANQKNDGFTDYLRVGRHPATIRHRTFFKIFYDEQRASSCGIALSGITENIITIDKKLTKSKCAVPFMFFRLLANEISRSISSNFVNKFEQVRNDDNLISRFFRWRLEKSTRWYKRFCNLYGYDIVTFYLQNGTLEEQSKEVNKIKYYLSYKKIYSNRYASDYLKTFFDEKGKAAKKGINDLPAFDDLYPSWNDIVSQNSYFGDSLKKNLGQLTEDKNETADNDFADLI